MEALLSTIFPDKLSNINDYAHLSCKGLKMKAMKSSASDCKLSSKPLAISLEGALYLPKAHFFKETH